MRISAVIALALCCFGFDRCSSQDAFGLIAGGFCLITPPSNLVSPGAVVMMLKDDQGRAQLQTICGPRASLSPMFSARVSDTLSSTFRMSRSQRLSLQAEAVERFRTRVSVEEVSEVQVELSRPRVVALEESDVFDHIDARTEACQRAIDTRLDAGFSPTIITQAYIADVQYLVTFRRDKQMTKRAREEKMVQIAAKLGGGHTEITEHALRAQNLTLAVRSDPFLLSIRPNAAPAPGPRPAPTHAPMGAPMAEVLPNPDAPYVVPAGGFVNPVIGN